MKLFSLEIKKILSRNQFILVSALLILADIFLLYFSERKTDTYFYVHENRDLYTAFLSGRDCSLLETDVSFYQQDADAQQKYQQEYYDFIHQMDFRVHNSIALSKSDLYLSRDTSKTLAAYQKLYDCVPVAGNNFGITVFSTYQYGAFFLILFVFFCIIRLICEERSKGYLLLVRSCLNGRSKLAIIKCAVLLTFTISFAVLLTFFELITSTFLYGLGSLDRPIQSVPVLRNSTLKITICEGLFLLCALRVLAASIIAGIGFGLYLMIKNSFSAFFLFGSVILVEFLLWEGISSSSILNGFKYVNLFHFWKMNECIGNYLNINIIGYPLTKNSLTGIVLSGCTICLLLFGILSFSHQCQIYTKNRLETILNKVHIWLHQCFQMKRIFSFELYKTLIQQKRIWVLVILLVFSGTLISNAVRTKYFTNAMEASYYYYIDRFGGILNAEKEAEISMEENRLTELQNALNDLRQNKNAEENQAAISVVNGELLTYQDGFDRLKQQIRLLNRKPSVQDNSYLINELEYLHYQSSSRPRVLSSMLALFLGISLTMNLFGFDVQKHMTNILYPTVKGKPQLYRIHIICGVVYFFLAYLAVEIPDLLSIHKIIPGELFCAPLRDVTILQTECGLSLGWLFVITAFSRLLIFGSVCTLCLFLGKRTKSGISTLIQSGSIILCIGTLFIVTHIDLFSLVLRMFGIIL